MEYNRLQKSLRIPALRTQQGESKLLNMAYKSAVITLLANMNSGLQIFS